jgi:hypothetical protein
MSANYSSGESGSKSSKSSKSSQSNNNDNNNQPTANNQAARAIPAATGNRAPVANGGYNNNTNKPSFAVLTFSTLPPAFSLFLPPGVASATGPPPCFAGVGAGCFAGF